MKCDFKLWQKPIPEPCPQCGAKFLVFAGGKKNPMLACPTEGVRLQEAHRGIDARGGAARSSMAPAESDAESASPPAT